MDPDEPTRPEGAIGGGRARGGAGRDSIEARFELAQTLAGLELAGEVAVPIGTDGRFVLRSLLGRGSMGAVYRADDLELERAVAIKVIARSVKAANPELRFRREARALAALDHPNVVKIFDLGREGEERFIAMELVEGTDLRTWQESRPRERVLDAYIRAGRGLAAAHARNIVHRDFKPDNVLVDEVDGKLRARVSDFGLVGSEELRTSDPAPLDDNLATAATIGRVGTLAYMAPEQLRGEVADARCDQHQFCVSLWEALAKARPFPSGRRLEDHAPVPPRPRSIPSFVYRVLRRGLASDPDRRFPSMVALLLALESGRRRARAKPWLSGVAVVVAAAGIAWTQRPDPCKDLLAAGGAAWNAEAREILVAELQTRPQLEVGRTVPYVADQIDAATASWAGQVEATCDAVLDGTPEERELSLRQRECLSRWVDHLDARLARLRISSSLTPEQVVDLVGPLELQSDACLLPPRLIDPKVEEALELVGHEEAVRDLDAAQAQARAAVGLAQQHGVACAPSTEGAPQRSSELAAALYRLGRVEEQRGDARGALDTLRQAHLHANACEDAHRDADARTHEAKVLAAMLSAPDVAALALEDAQVALRRVGEPPTSLRRYEERMAAGIVAAHSGAPQDARRFAEQGLRSLGEPSEHPVLAAKLLHNVGVAYQNEGRYSEAARSYDEASALVSTALGPEHPRSKQFTALRELNLGLAAQDLGDLDGMRRHVEAVVALGTPELVVDARTAWLQAVFEASDEPTARDAATALLEAVAANPELPPLTLATGETTAGQVLAALSDRRGLDVLRRACSRWEELGGAEEVAACELSLGRAYRDDGREAEARSIAAHLQSLAPISESTRAAIEEFAKGLRSEAEGRP